MTATSSIDTRDRRWGLGLALAAHVTLFTVGSLAWQQRAQYGMDASQGAIDVDLVAAPPAEAPQAPVIAPPPPKIVPDANDVIQPEKTPTAQVVAAPSPVATPHPAAMGQDAITLHRTGGSQALAKPGYLRNPPPPYPVEARHLKQQGRVLLTVSVDTEGRVSAATLKESSGFPLLDDAALKGVRNWRFHPASVGGLRVASDVEIPIRFQLK